MDSPEDFSIVRKKNLTLEKGGKTGSTDRGDKNSKKGQNATGTRLTPEADEGPEAVMRKTQMF